MTEQTKSRPVLAPLEARCLGVLIEKEKTVPDSYPLSLNALSLGCNQKNNRDPVLSASDSEILAAVDELKHRSMVIESSGSRVMRYSQNLGRVLRVPEQSVALLATLMLRGAQTAGELRGNAERLHRFADISSVEAFLEELAARPDEQGGALVAKLPRRAGEREQRWAQLLTGPVETAVQSAAAVENAGNAGAGDEATALAALRAQVEQLAVEVQALRSEIDALKSTR